MDTFDAACYFPWPSGMFAHLGRYIASVDQFLELAQDSQAKSIKDAIALETDPVAVGELHYELARLNGEDSLSSQRLVWGGLLVSIYATFEHGLEQIFEHWRVATNGTAFKAKGGEDIVAAAVRHSSESLELALFKTTLELVCLNQLRTLRNSFVHKGGRLIAFPADTWSAIQWKKGLGFPLDVIDERWCANTFAARHYLNGANHVLHRFSREVFDKLSIRPQ